MGRHKEDRKTGGQRKGTGRPSKASRDPKQTQLNFATTTSSSTQDIPPNAV